MLSRQPLLAALVVVLAAGAVAHGADKKSSDDASTNLSDQDLDQRRANLDVKLANRTSGVKQGLDKIASFQLKAEKDRLDFERYIAEERKAFYLFLKSVKADEREKELERFTDKQDKERVDFDKKELSEQRDWFHEAIEKRSKSESLELESGSAPMRQSETAPAAAPAIKEPAMAPEKKATAAHKAVYKKKSRPAVKKKAKAAAAEAPVQSPSMPAEQSTSQPPAPQAPSAPDSGGADAPAPPPPGQ